MTMDAGRNSKKTQEAASVVRMDIGHIPHEMENAVVWTREMERTARTHATSGQHDSKRPRGRPIKIYGHESEWNGG